MIFVKSGEIICDLYIMKPIPMKVAAKLMILPERREDWDAEVAENVTEKKYVQQYQNYYQGQFGYWNKLTQKWEKPVNSHSSLTDDTDEISIEEKSTKREKKIQEMTDEEFNYFICQHGGGL